MYEKSGLNFAFCSQSLKAEAFRQSQENGTVVIEKANYLPVLCGNALDFKK